jgi:hypothetical protein
MLLIHSLRVKIAFLFSFSILLTGCANVIAQPAPVKPQPASVSIYPLQGLSFGAFFQSKTGGSIIIAPTGERSATGSVILAELGYSHGPASFGIEAPAGTMINILNGPDTKLTGSTGGSITLHVGRSFPSSPFVSSSQPNGVTTVDIGGTITVGSAAATPPGSYSGYLYITFVQE